MARCFVIALLVAVSSSLAADEAPRWVAFLGRFHFVVLHLPIGLLSAIAVLEAGSIIRGGTAVTPGRGPLAWSLGVASTITIICGWLLAWNPEEYDMQTLFWHRWGGVFVGALSWLLVGAHHLHVRRPAFAGAVRIILVISLIAAAVVGHHGGTLTHGRGFLTRYAPTWLGGRDATPAVVATSATEATTPSAINSVSSDPIASQPGSMPDGMAGGMAPFDPPADPPMTGLTFAKDIEPILKSRCIECHGADKQKASLRLDTAAVVQAGGKSGPIVVAGHPDRSELLRLVALPADDDDIMPPKGDPLTTAQIDTIRAWIAAGADFGDGPSEIHPAPTDAKQVARETAFETVAASLTAPDADIVAKLTKAGVVVRGMDPSGRTLELNASHAKVDVALLESLKRIAPNILWLDLGETSVNDDALAALKPLTNLEKLDLTATAVSDNGLVHLINLKSLRYLTLVRTKVSDAGLYRLAGLKNLERVYLWGSKATANGGKRLTSSIPGCVVNTGPTGP